MSLASYIASLFARRQTKQWIEGFSGVPVSETDGGKLFAIVGLKNRCPDCGGAGFYEGPMGGLSQNIYCVNRNCRSAFNITWFDGQIGICDRIGKCDIGQYPTTSKGS